MPKEMGVEMEVETVDTCCAQCDRILRICLQKQKNELDRLLEETARQETRCNSNK